MLAQEQNTTAINDYLIDKYDISRRLTYESEPKKYQIQQWFHFQSSGQGPYFRQAAWCFTSSLQCHLEDPL